MSQQTNIAEDIRSAVVAAKAGNWEAAHAVAQSHEGDAHADWLHAILHRIEGDDANARYWYGRCSRTLNPDLSTDAELDALVEAIS